MELKKHYFITCAALFFLGMIITSPDSSFTPVRRERECKMVKGKMNCDSKHSDYRTNYPNIHYEF
jgi:hypothetical protein